MYHAVTIYGDTFKIVHCSDALVRCHKVLLSESILTRKYDVVSQFRHSYVNGTRDNTRSK